MCRPGLTCDGLACSERQGETEVYAVSSDHHVITGRRHKPRMSTQ
jgi:hypothetical protein